MVRWTDLDQHRRSFAPDVGPSAERRVALSAGPAGRDGWDLNRKKGTSGTKQGMPTEVASDRK